jgi:Adenylosuccinate lyase C-terminus
MRAWEEETDFAELVRADPEISGHVDLEAVFDLEATVRHVDTVFERLHALVHKEVPVHA